MKTKLIFVIGLCTTIAFVNCRNFNKTELHIENRLNKNIDSVVIYFDGHKTMFTNLKPQQIISKSIPWDSINLGHDISIIPYVYLKDSAFNGQYYYTDLGSVFKEGKFIITDSMSTHWEIIEF